MIILFIQINVNYLLDSSKFPNDRQAGRQAKWKTGGLEYSGLENFPWQNGIRHARVIEMKWQAKLVLRECQAGGGPSKLHRTYCTHVRWTLNFLVKLITLDIHGIYQSYHATYKIDKTFFFYDTIGCHNKSVDKSNKSEWCVVRL